MQGDHLQQLIKDFEATLEQNHASQASLDSSLQQLRHLDARQESGQQIAGDSQPSQHHSGSPASHGQVQQQQPLLAAPDPLEEQPAVDPELSASASRSTRQNSSQTLLQDGHSHEPAQGDRHSIHRLPEHEQVRQDVHRDASSEASSELHAGSVSSAKSSSKSSSGSSSRATYLPLSTKRKKAVSSKGSGVAAAIGPLLQAMQGLLAVTGVTLTLNLVLEAQVAPFMRPSRNARQGDQSQPAQQPSSRCVQTSPGESSEPEQKLQGCTIFHSCEAAAVCNVSCHQLGTEGSQLPGSCPLLSA